MVRIYSPLFWKTSMDFPTLWFPNVFGQRWYQAGDQWKGGQQQRGVYRHLFREVPLPSHRQPITALSRKRTALGAALSCRCDFSGPGNLSLLPFSVVTVPSFSSLRALHHHHLLISFHFASTSVTFPSLHYFLKLLWIHNLFPVQTPYAQVWGRTGWLILPHLGAGFTYSHQHLPFSPNRKSILDFTCPLGSAVLSCSSPNPAGFPDPKLSLPLGLQDSSPPAFHSDSWPSPTITWSRGAAQPSPARPALPQPTSCLVSTRVGVSRKASPLKRSSLLSYLLIWGQIYQSPKGELPDRSFFLFQGYISFFLIKST